MLTVSYALKDFFFDRLRVQQMMEKKTHNYMFRAGAYLRKTGRSIQKKKGKARAAPKKVGSKAYQKWLDEIANPPPSPPGKPPNAHSDHPAATLRNILYGYNPRMQSLIAGPALLNGSKRKNPTVPELHEYGGSQVIREKLVGNKWVPIGRRAPRPGQPSRRRRANYPARPYMAPALAKTMKKFPDLWYGHEGSEAA